MVDCKTVYGLLNRRNLRQPLKDVYRAIRSIDFESSFPGHFLQRFINYSKGEADFEYSLS